jgi:hypothetical protein
MLVYDCNPCLKDYLLSTTLICDERYRRYELGGQKDGHMRDCMLTQKFLGTNKEVLHVYNLNGHSFTGNNISKMVHLSKFF